VKGIPLYPLRGILVTVGRRVPGPGPFRLDKKGAVHLGGVVLAVGWASFFLGLPHFSPVLFMRMIIGPQWRACFLHSVFPVFASPFFLSLPLSC